MKKTQECALSRASRLDLTVSKSPKEAHVWSMQWSWRVTPVGALQDKISSLAKQLACCLDSRLNQVARPSRQTTLFVTNLNFRIPNTHQYKYPLYPHIVECFQREFWEKNSREKQDWLIHSLYTLILQISLLSPSPSLHSWEVYLTKSFSHHTHICEKVIWCLRSN